MPHQQPTRLEHATELRDHTDVVAWIQEEAERREQVEHGIEPARPGRRKPSHVAAAIPQVGSYTPIARDLQEFRRVVEAVDAKSRFGQQVCVPPLPARYVEEPRAGRESKHLQQAPDLRAIFGQAEDRLELQQVLRTEVRRPPLTRCGRGVAASLFPRRQKNTGSRYAPNLSSMAWRISYRVQLARAQSRMNGMRFWSVPAASVRACKRASTSD